MFLNTPILTTACVSSFNASSHDRDLGFSQWETSTLVESASNRYFEVYRAKPRGRRLPFGFLLKALRPQYCLDSPLGAKLIERERFVGSFESIHVLPVVDWRYPQRVSSSQATRGYVALPYVSSVTLRQALDAKLTLDEPTLRKLSQGLRELALDLTRNGWALESLSSDQLLVSISDDAPNNESSFSYLALHDYSTTSSFNTPSLFETNASNCVDENFRFSPDAFYSSRVSSKTTATAVATFLQQLKKIAS